MPSIPDSFLAISRRCHLEFSGGCGDHVSGCVLALGVTMGCPSFPDGYAFSWPGASLWIQFVFVHKLDSWGGARLWRGVLILGGEGDSLSRLARVHGLVYY